MAEFGDKSCPLSGQTKKQRPHILPLVKKF